MIKLPICVNRPGEPRLKIDNWLEICLDGLIILLLLIFIVVGINEFFVSSIVTPFQQWYVICHIMLIILCVITLADLLAVSILCIVHKQQLKQWLQSCNSIQDDCINSPLLDKRYPIQVTVYCDENNKMWLQEQDILNESIKEWSDKETDALQSLFNEDVPLSVVDDLLKLAADRKKTGNSPNNKHYRNGMSVCAMLTAMVNEGWLDERWLGCRKPLMDKLVYVLGTGILEDKHFLDYIAERKTSKPYLRLIETYQQMIKDSLDEA